MSELAAGPVAKEGELLKVHYKGAVSDGNKVVCRQSPDELLTGTLRLSIRVAG